jgi:hypothetical protein
MLRRPKRSKNEVVVPEEEEEEKEEDILLQPEHNFGLTKLAWCITLSCTVTVVTH